MFLLKFDTNNASVNKKHLLDINQIKINNYSLKNILFKIKC